MGAVCNFCTPEGANVISRFTTHETHPTTHGTDVVAQTTPTRRFHTFRASRSQNGTLAPFCKTLKLKLSKAKGKNAYSTPDSQAVSDPSTKRAQRCLTWLIGREAVCSTWYGRKRGFACEMVSNVFAYYLQL